MKSIHKLFALLLIVVAILSACTKEMGVYEFVATPKPPKREVLTDPDDVRPFKLTYKGATYNEQMVGAITVLSSKTYFKFSAKLSDNERLDIVLPLNDLGYVSSGKYILRNNEPENGENTPYQLGILDRNAIPLVDYREGAIDDNSDRYNFTLEMEIDSMNKEEHLITGFIDELRIVSKTDPSQEFLITNGEFAVFYNHIELQVNGEDPISYNGGNLQNMLEVGSSGGWNSAWTSTAPNGISKFNSTWRAELWSAENISLFNTNKGVGTYVRPFVNVNYSTYSIVYIISTSPAKVVLPSEALTLKISNFHEKQFAKGTVEFKGKEVNMTTRTSFIDNSPEYDVKFSFAHRQILW